MKIVVNTPAGHIGSRVVGSLLGASHEVVIISRHPDKVAGAVQRGARLVQGSIDDPDVLDRAFGRGADGLLWVTPIAFEHPDYMSWARHVGRLAADRARRHAVRRAVLVSSIGAQHDSGVGPIGCLPAIEHAFEQALPEVTALRPGSFMENLFMHAGSIAQAGTMFGSYPATKKITWIATRDIADEAVERLTGRHPEGFRVRELHGPEDLDQTQAAALIAEGIGRPVQYVEVTEQQARQGMLAAGMPASFVDLMIEMYAGLRAGRMEPTQARSAATTTRTTLVQFAREELKPAVDAALRR